MARRRGQKALYEVIGKAKLQPGSTKTETLHPDKPVKPEPLKQKINTVLPKKKKKWPVKPKMFQILNGRIELSIPYQVFIALGLVMILLFVLVYRLGENAALKNSKNSSMKASVGTGPVSTTDFTEVTQPEKVEKTQSSASKSTVEDENESKGNNRIVIQTFELKSQLEPVKDYFAEHGIDTEIKQIGNWYYLITTDRFESVRPGTEGYTMRQKIRNLGSQYKAPTGYESFGVKPFDDAFGMKFED